MKESLLKAQAKYKAKVLRPVRLNLHRELDKDIIDKLESEPSMQGYIKQAIRSYMGSQK